MQSSPSPVCEYYTYFWGENRELRIEDNLSTIFNPQFSILVRLVTIRVYMNLWTLTRTVRQMVQQTVTGNKGIVLAEGTPAPDFDVPDENGKRHTLKEYRGKKVILWFFPRASTPG